MGPCLAEVPGGAGSDGRGACSFFATSTLARFAVYPARVIIRKIPKAIVTWGSDPHHVSLNDSLPALTGIGHAALNRSPVGVLARVLASRQYMC